MFVGQEEIKKKKIANKRSSAGPERVAALIKLSLPLTKHFSLITTALFSTKKYS